VILLFVVYEVYVTDWISAGKQRDATAALDQRWKLPESKADAQRQDHFAGLREGDGFAKMYVPVFGADYHFTILEGTTESTLEVGPGHYKGTAYPGQNGNFAVAGHRVGKGAPFNDIDLLSSCDAVVVETRDNWFVYRVLPRSDEANGWATGKGKQVKCKNVAPLGGPYSGLAGQEIVLPSQGTVVAPVPHQDAIPNGGAQVGLMTLTTCNPKFSDRQRLIVHAVLVHQIPKGQLKPGQLPDELKES
jgi:sortase (surface protein transpeptidase)